MRPIIAEERTWYYEDIKELFGDDPNCLVIQLLRRLEKTEIDCEIREQALYKIRKLVEGGSEISKIAGKALCHGNYTR